MKRSVSVCVPLLLGLAGCSPEKAIDPCDHDKFDDKNCGQAVAHGGYYYRGIWRPQTYNQPYSYYEAEARSYAAHGGVPHPAPASEYSPSYSRGVFGSTGDEAAGHGGGEGEGGHGGGGGEGGGGE